MVTVILFGGLSLYLVVTVIFLRVAREESPLWAWISVLLPPVALFYYVIYWHRRWPLFTAHTVGLALTLLGGVLVLRANPSQFDNTFLADVRDKVAPASINRPLNIAGLQFSVGQQIQTYIGRIDGVMGGRLFGEPVQIESVELVNGVLRFRRGNGFFPQRELAVFVGITELDVDDRWELNVNPASDDVPILHVSRYDARTGRLDTEVYDRGYRMELVLSDRRKNQVSGFIRLLLPSDNQDFIAGNFESYTSQLRYSGDHIDRFHDSNDTIEYVALQHLQNKFRKAVENVAFTDTYYLEHAAAPTAKTIAELQLIDDSVHTIPLMLFKGEQGWTVNTRSTDDLRIAIQTLLKRPPAAGVADAEQSPQALFDGTDYKRLVGKRIKVISTEGKIRQGLLSQVQRSQLILHQPMDGGYMDVHLPKRKIDQIVVVNTL